jgi:hypothetical protein
VEGIHTRLITDRGESQGLARLTTNEPTRRVTSLTRSPAISAAVTVLTIICTQDLIGTAVGLGLSIILVGYRVGCTMNPRCKGLRYWDRYVALPRVLPGHDCI